MTKTICDICGEEIPTILTSDAIYNLNFCISSYGKMWDICNECREDLNGWMAIRKWKKIRRGNSNLTKT